jgi:hypothetical protein
MLNIVNNILFIKELLHILGENIGGWEAKFQKEQNYVSNIDMTQMSREI